MQNNKPRILLAAPTSKHKDYCFDNWARHIKKLTYSVDILIVDNTDDRGIYAKSKIAKHFPVMHINPKPEEDNFNLVCRSQNIIRNFFLAKEYDYLFMLESDHFPPYNVIEYMLVKRKRIVSLPYFIGTAFKSKILQFDMEDFGDHRQSKVMNPDKTFVQWDGKLKPKHQTGLGCTLIRREIMEKIKFRIPEDNSIAAHSDVYFHQDLRKLGIDNFVSESCFSQHQNTGWFNILKK